LQKLRVVVKEEKHQTIRVCEPIQDRIECPWNLNQTSRITKQYVDTKKGLLVFLHPYSYELIKTRIMNCSEFETCETCTMLGFYNPCIWRLSQCVDKEVKIESSDHCFEAYISYKNLTEGKITLSVSLPYLFREDFGERVYLEFNGSRIDNVSYSDGSYSTVVDDVPSLNNSWINFIRLTGGPMRIPLRDGSATSEPPTESTSPTQPPHRKKSSYLIYLVIILIVIILASCSYSTTKFFQRGKDQTEKSSIIEELRIPQQTLSSKTVTSQGRSETSTLSRLTNLSSYSPADRISQFFFLSKSKSRRNR